MSDAYNAQARAYEKRQQRGKNPTVKELLEAIEVLAPAFKQRAEILGRVLEEFEAKLATMPIQVAVTYVAQNGDRVAWDRCSHGGSKWRLLVGGVGDERMRPACTSKLVLKVIAASLAPGLLGAFESEVRMLSAAMEAAIRGLPR